MTCPDCKNKEEILFGYYGIFICLACKEKRKNELDEFVSKNRDEITKMINERIKNMR